MTEPIFWLGLSILLVAVSLTAVLVVAIPVLQELARAARSAEKLFDTLRQELPPTLEAIRLTGLEISDLTDEVNEGVQRASNVAKQVDEGVAGAKQQVQTVNTKTRSVFTGVKVAWKTLTKKPKRNPDKGDSQLPRLPSNEQEVVGLAQPKRERQNNRYRQFSPVNSLEQAGLDDALENPANSAQQTDEEFRSG